MEWFNDPEVLNTWRMHQPALTGAQENWFDKILKAREDEHPFAIEVNEAAAAGG